MVDQRDFEAGSGQFSKSGWVRRQTIYPKQPNQKENNWEMEGFTTDDTFADPADNSDDPSDVFTSSDHWSLPWSDLMMTMFVLFAVLLSVHVSERNVVEAAHSKVQVSKENVPANDPIAFPSGEVEHTPEKIYHLSNQAVRLSNLEQIEVIFEEDKTVRISVRGPLFFDTGHAALRDNTKKFLDRLLPILREIDNEIHIVGHTDDIPVRGLLYPSNWELSSSRASNIAKYLIEAGFLEPGRFSVIGRSMYRPELPNITEENRQINRRVDIIITSLHYDST